MAPRALCVLLSVVLLSASSKSQHDYATVLELASQYLQTTRHIGNGGFRDASRAAVNLRRFMMEIAAAAFGISGIDEHEADAIRDRFASELMVSNVTSDCTNQTLQVMEGIFARDTWALQMLDAVGKPGAGLMEMYWKWLGSYDQCLNVSIAPGNTSQTPRAFRTQYCLSLLPLAPAPNQSSPVPMASLGTCFPESCSSQDVQTVLNLVLNLSSLPVPSQQLTTCQGRELQMGSQAIAAVFVGALFLVLILLGTSYDIVVIQWPKWCPDAVVEEHPINTERQQQEEEEGEEEEIRSVGEATPINIHHYLNSSDHTPLLDEAKMALLSSLDRQEEQGVFGRMLEAFSLYLNGGRLLATGQSEGTLTCIHGIRFLSMTWVILGHVVLLSIPISQNSLPYLSVAIKQWPFEVILNGFFSVDSFFAISGLLVTYLTMREMEKQKGKVNWFKFYFHRYWRLTPPYMLLLFLYISLFPYLGDGPLWPQRGLEMYCNQTWWTNLLYVNNLVYSDKMCLGWTWYLANDMQFYVVSPLILIPLYRFRRLGYVILFVFLLATTISPGVIAYVNRFHSGIYRLTDKNYSQMVYYKPYCRMGPYLVGMATGFLLYQCQCQARLSKVAVVAGWLVSSASALAVLYGLYNENNGTMNSESVDALYFAVSSSVWGASVCWVIFACVTGHAGFVNTLLSWRVFAPLGRLTYMAYLVHVMVLFAFFYSQQSPVFVSNLNYAFLFVSMVTVSYAAAFVLWLVLEAPMLNLEKALFNSRGWRRSAAGASAK